MIFCARRTQPLQVVTVLKDVYNVSWGTWVAIIPLTVSHVGILDPRCKEGNAIYSKLGASIVLKGILDIFLDPNDLTVNEDTEEAHHRHPITDSIVAAPRVPVAEGVKVEILQKSFSS